MTHAVQKIVSRLEQAATDAKGAAVYIKSVFAKVGLPIKVTVEASSQGSVADGYSEQRLRCSGNLQGSPYAFFILLNDKGEPFVDFLDMDALNVQHLLEDVGNENLPEWVFVNPKGHDGSKQVVKYANDLEKSTRNVMGRVNAITAWWTAFSRALLIMASQISKN